VTKGSDSENTAINLGGQVDAFCNKIVILEAELWMFLRTGKE
jgi:hypothetical protein